MPISDKEARRAIQRALAEVRTVDPHTHLTPQRPVARTLADIVLYHHVWIEMVSAGMGQRETNATGMPHELEDPGIPPDERVRRALPWLPRIRNTAVAMMLRWILEDIYDFHEPLGAANAERLAGIVADRAGDAGWEERLFAEVCGIEKSISVQTTDPRINPRILAASEALGKVNLTDGKRTPREVLSDLDKRLGREVRTAADYCATLDKIVASFPVASLQFLGAWVTPAFAPDFARETDVTRIIGAARAGTPTSAAEMGSVAWFGLAHCLERLRATSLRTIQVILGAEVLVPHRSLTQWGGGFAMSFGRFAGLFEDFHFNMSTAAEAHVQDLAILAKHVPNVSVAGYWWHTFYPALIRKSLETRLEMVPLGKIIGFFSDAYHAEWCYPKLKLVKLVLCDILSERVSRGWYTLDDALAVIQTILHDAPKRIYATG